MKNFILIIGLFASLFFIVNCTPNRSSSGDVGAVATANGACPAGYWYTNGQCYNGSGAIPSQFNYGIGFWADNHSGYASININGEAGKNLMKQLYKLGMGVCDRGASNYGAANCDYYISGQTDIIIQFPTNSNANTPSSALLTIFAKPQMNPYYNYQASGSWWSLVGSFFGVYIPDFKYYSGAYRNPLQIQMAVTATNGGKGFSASAYGDAWTGYNNTLLTVEVLNADVVNGQYLDYSFKISGQTAATGRMSRCQTQNCGI